MPIGPALFQLPEPVGVPDLACCFLELGAAALAAPMALMQLSAPTRGPRRVTRERVDRTTVALAVVVGAIAVAATGWGLGPAANGTGHGVHSHVSVGR
jgi:hypothetical protein